MSTVSSLWWAFPNRTGHLAELDADECRELLRSTTVGRLGYTSERGPRIIPVNYALTPTGVVFRTSQSSEVAQLALGRSVAFEVDQVDHFLRSGWSVLVVGPLSELSYSEVRLLTPDELPQPWRDGIQTLVCHVPFAEISGRRILPG